METVNAVIDEASEFGSEKISEEIPNEILPPEPMDVQEIVDQVLASPSIPGTLSVVEGSTDIPTSPDSESHKEKGPSSRIKLNHPPEVIVGNMNELIPRKRTIDNVLLTLCLILTICHRLNPPRLMKLFRMKAGLRLCMMNCFNFK